MNKRAVLWTIVGLLLVAGVVTAVTWKPSSTPVVNQNTTNIGTTPNTNATSSFDTNDHLDDALRYLDQAE